MGSSAQGMIPYNSCSSGDNVDVDVEIAAAVC